MRRAQSVTSERNAPTRCTWESYRILGQAGLADWLQRESRLGNARLNPANPPGLKRGAKVHSPRYPEAARGNTIRICSCSGGVASGSLR